MNKIKFSVDGEPAPWGVYTRRTRSPSKDRLKTYQDLIRLAARQAMVGREPHEGPVWLELHFYRGMPARAPRHTYTLLAWAARHVLKRPDVDNLGKGCCDAMNGIVFLDDAQVVQKTVTKRFGRPARTICIVRFLEADDPYLGGSP